MKYSISWRDDNGHACTISISEFGKNDTSAPINITPSASPFVTEETDDNDLMLPIRPTTGKISVLCYAADVIKIERDNQWRVEMKRDNRIMFLGFLKSESVDMEYSAELEEFTYTVIDDLEALKCWNIPNVHGYRMIGEMLCDAFFCIRSVDDGVPIYIDDAIIRPHATASVNDALEMEVNRWLWHRDGYNDGETYYDVLEAIARALGVTIRSRGDFIFLYSPMSNYYYQGELTDGPGWCIEEESHKLNMDNWTWHGPHSITYEPPVGCINVESSAAETEDSVEFATSDLDFGGTMLVRNGIWSDSRYSWKFFFAKWYETVGKHITTTRPMCDNLRGSMCNANSRALYTGTMAASIGYKSPINDEDETNVKFNDCLYFVQRASSADSDIIGIPDTTTIQSENIPATDAGRTKLNSRLATLAKQNSIRYSMKMPLSSVTHGGLDIKITAYHGAMRTHDNFGGFVPFLGSMVDKASSRFSFALVSLKIGDGYYAPGKTATYSTEQLFRISMEREDSSEQYTVATNKTLDMEFSADGYAINLAPLAARHREPLDCDVTLTCYGFYDTYEYDGIIRQYFSPACVAVEEFSLSYCEPLISGHREESSSATWGDEGSTQDELSEKTILYADAKVKRSAGTLRYNNGYLDTVYLPQGDGNGAGGSLGKCLVARYKRANARSRTLVKLSTDLVDDEMPVQIHEDYGQAISTKMDYRTGVATLTMYQDPGPLTDEEGADEDVSETIYVDFVDGRIVSATLSRSLPCDFSIFFLKQTDNEYTAPSCVFRFAAGETAASITTEVTYVDYGDDYDYDYYAPDYVSAKKAASVTTEYFDGPNFEKDAVILSPTSMDGYSFVLRVDGKEFYHS